MNAHSNAGAAGAPEITGRARAVAAFKGVKFSYPPKPQTPAHLTGCARTIAAFKAAQRASNSN